MLWHNNDNNRRIMTRDYNARSGRLKNVQVVCILLQEAQSIPFIKEDWHAKRVGSWNVCSIFSLVCTSQRIFFKNELNRGMPIISLSTDAFSGAVSEKIRGNLWCPAKFLSTCTAVHELSARFSLSSLCAKETWHHYTLPRIPSHPKYSLVSPLNF